MKSIDVCVCVVNQLERELEWNRLYGKFGERDENDENEMFCEIKRSEIATFIPRQVKKVKWGEKKSKKKWSKRWRRIRSSQTKNGSRGLNLTKFEQLWKIKRKKMICKCL